METEQFDDRAPEASQLTAYDESHLAAYLRLLDADHAAVDWHDSAATILGIDASSEPLRAKTMYDSHLARARWMTEIGYAHLLGNMPPIRR